MRIGILGSGALAGALAAAWARAGHELMVGGRSLARARALAQQLGPAARAGTPREAVTGRDAVLLAVMWDGVAGILRSAGAAEGTLNGVPLIDPTNDVEHGIGVLRAGPGESGAQRIAALAPGARVSRRSTCSRPGSGPAAGPGGGEQPLGRRGSGVGDS